jgi:hypothetical protein
MRGTFARNCRKPSARTGPQRATIYALVGALKNRPEAFDDRPDTDGHQVSLVAAGSVTGSFNSDQRLIWLDITTKTPSTATVAIPYNDAVAPPGDYVLFVLKQNPRAGAPAIPSIGCWTKR